MLFADKILISENIITVNDEQPTAEAVAVANGKILKVGNKDEVMSFKNEKTEIIDLKDKTMVPGFIDSHSHFGLEILIAEWANTQPAPYGNCNSIDDIIDTMKKHIKDNNIKKGDWAIGFGNSTSEIKEKRHLTKFDLDKVSTDHPVVVWHLSVHFVACNTMALKMFGFDENMEDPFGGKFHRVNGTRELNGLCEGTARYQVALKLPQPTMEDNIRKLKKAEQLYLKYGVTTVQEGATRPDDFNILKYAVENNELTVDVIAFPLMDRERQMKDGGIPVGEYKNHCKLGGIKMVADGSYYGTLKLTEPYNKVNEDDDENNTGQMYHTQEEIEEFIKLGFENNWPLLVHNGGDGCIDTFMDAYEKEAKLLNVDTSKRRDVILHYLFPRLEQADRVEKLNLFPALLSPRVYFARESDVKSYGQERIDRCCPISQFVDKNMKFTLHIDSPCYPPDHMIIMDSAVNRVSIENKLTGPEFRISPLDALKGVTINGAYQYYDEDIKGSIEEGKLADFAILDKNPLEIDPMQIKNIKVVETIKEGKTVFKI